MIRMVHDRGMTCPHIFCDHCEERIVGTGNYQFLMALHDPDYQAAVYFTHKHCCRAFEHRHPAPEGFKWGWTELEAFPIYLGNNLRLDWKAAKETARLFAAMFA
jgi:hypothetical protein